MEIDYDVPDLEEGVSDWTGTHTWRVENWTKLTEEKIYSPEFEVGGYSWRLLVFPRGNKAHASADHISFYLDFAQPSFTPREMYPKPNLELFAVKSTNPADSMRAVTTHIFSALTPTWGFPQFLPIQEALNLQNGYLVDDTLTLGVKINIKIDGTLGMTSKAETGFVGIKTLGEKSLLSSFLQCLFHVKVFRKAVYEIPNLESDYPQKSLPLALQHLFCELQYQNTSVETKDLAKSLDLDFDDVFLQHDVVEIQRALFGKLAEQDKIGRAKDCISDLFMGEYSNYIKSPSMPEAQTPKQSYTEIPLSVLECKDIYASLEKFCQIKRWEENNYNRATGRGLNESKHYTLFDSFPTILQFNLEQYHYNPHRNAILQVNSRFEIYDELDLDYNDGKLLSKDADRSIENKYKLHSVVVHAGSPNKGRYFAFIRCDEKWYKFDGEVVKVVTAEEAIDAQFGDRDGQVSANFSERFKSINKSAAVMLVYIHKSEWERVMCEAENLDLPKQIKDRFETGRVRQEKQLKQKNAHLFVNIKLATEFHFAEQTGKKHYFDLANSDSFKNYQIYKKTPFEHFKEMVWKDFEIPKDQQRFWLWNEQAYSTARVSETLIEGEHDLKTVLDLRHFKDNALSFNLEQDALMTIKLFLESPEKASLNGDIPRNTLHPIQQNEMLIFLKYYDPESSKLSYLGHMFVEKTCPFYVIFGKAKKLAGIAYNETVIGFKEVRRSATLIHTDWNPKLTPQELQLIQGDIIIIQKVAAKNQCEYPTVKDLFDFVQNGKTITFKPLKNPKDEGFKLDLLTTLSYDQVTNALAKHLQVDDPKRLRLTRHNFDTLLPHKSPVEHNGIGSLDQMILHSRQRTNILYYEVLDMRSLYLKSLKSLNIKFHNANGALQSCYQVRLPKECRVSDLVQVLKLKLGEEYIDCDVRVMVVFLSKVYKVLDGESVLQELHQSHHSFRAEIIPEDQKNLTSDEFLVLFCHCKPNDGFITPFGDPFWVKVKKGEIVREVKVRIQKTLEVSNEEFSQWRIAYHSRPCHPVEYLSDEDEILAKFPRDSSKQKYGKYVGDRNSFIVLEH